jgi:lambda family phage minor tail protein L
MAYVVTGYWVAGYVTSDSETALSNALQDVAPGAVIELFQLELNTAQHGVDVTYYFHAGVNQLITDITWNGQAYQALPMEAEGFELTGKGTLPRPTLRISNLSGTISTLIATLPEGLQGAKVTRIRTLGRFLDAVNFSGGTNPTADPLAEFPRQVYFIDRLALENRDVIEFELASVFDLVGVRAPKRQCVTRCQWKYRGDGCGYTGTNYYDINGNVVYSPSQDVCSKTVSGCELRFGANQPLPFGGYPSIGTYFS